MKSEGEICFNDHVLKGWRVLYNGMGTARAGVAVVLAPHVQLVDVDHVMEGRITLVRVKVNGIKLGIYSCYCPTEDHSDTTKESFYRTLNKSIQKLKKDHPSYKVIVAGDFNATIGQDCNHESWMGVGSFNDDAPTSYNGEKLIETSESNDLYILNTLFATRSDEHRWSFHSNRGYKRRLDYILTDWYVRRFTTNCRVYPMQSQVYESASYEVYMSQLLLKSTKNQRKQRISNHLTGRKRRTSLPL